MAFPANDKAVTIPEEEPTVALEVLPLVHVPPPASLRVVVEPEHTFADPDIGAGSGSTVNSVVAMQLVVSL